MRQEYTTGRRRNAYTMIPLLAGGIIAAALTYSSPPSDEPESVREEPGAIRPFAEWFERAVADNSGTKKEVTLRESGSPAERQKENLWLNSGGIFFVSGAGEGRTLMGDLPPLSFWKIAYFLSSRTDTDNGAHPQNLFRLLTTDRFLDLEQELSAVIVESHASKSTNRNASNGVFLMGRYQDNDNLYYMGVRVDGAAVIKKKAGGVYHTLGYTTVWPGSYDRFHSPTLLPQRKPFGIRARITQSGSSAVRIELSVDREGTGSWKRVLHVTDRIAGDAPAIRDPGLAGIRTDFMDVEFKQYIVRTKYTSPHRRE